MCRFLKKKKLSRKNQKKKYARTTTSKIIKEKNKNITFCSKYNSFESSVEFCFVLCS